MRQVATLIMFVLLLFVGYSVGTAIAKNNNDMMNNSSSDGMDGVYVVEEEYGVVATRGSLTPKLLVRFQLLLPMVPL